MSHDDYFRIVFIILKSLYKYKKAHKKFDLDEISADVTETNEECCAEMINDSQTYAIFALQTWSGQRLNWKRMTPHLKTLTNTILRSIIIPLPINI